VLQLNCDALDFKISLKIKRYINETVKAKFMGKYFSSLFKKWGGMEVMT
jgi:hypothetical protein